MPIILIINNNLPSDYVGIGVFIVVPIILFMIAVSFFMSVISFSKLLMLLNNKTEYKEHYEYLIYSDKPYILGIPLLPTMSFPPMGFLSNRAWKFYKNPNLDLPEKIEKIKKDCKLFSKIFLISWISLLIAFIGAFLIILFLQSKGL